MTEAEWRTATDPRLMLDGFRAKASDRKLRLLACGVCRRLAAVVGRLECDAAAEVGERYADTGRTKVALKQARQSLRSTRHTLVGRPEWMVFWLTEVALSENGFRSFARSLSDYLASAATGFPMWVKNDGAACDLIRCIFGNPFHPVLFDPAWVTSTAVALAAGIYADRAFDRLPILADVLDEAGCDVADVLSHCRSDGPHVRGCWVLDLLLNKL